MRASTAIGVSPVIKERVTTTSNSVRLTLKETILMGMMAIEALDEGKRNELANTVHSMQIEGNI